LFKEFKEFALKGNMIDLAVGVIIGAAFGAVMTSLVSDILMPLLGLLSGGVDFSNKMLVLKEGATAGPYATPAAAATAGAVTLNWGLFLNAILAFLLVVIALFIVIKGINRMKREAPAADPTTKACPQCAMEVPVAATRCGHCTSQIA